MASSKLMTPEFRVSFPAVFKPDSFSDDQEKKYKVTMLFPKETDLAAMYKMAEEVCREKWGKDIPKNLRNPFRDGEEKDLDGYAGMFFVNCSTKQKPGVVDMNVQPIIDESEFYAGCWAKATVTCYAYGGPGTKYRAGVAFGLQNLQKQRDDDAFSGRSKAEDDFTAVETGSEDPANYEQDNASGMFSAGGGSQGAAEEKTKGPSFLT